jgi:hypothetical protein
VGAGSEAGREGGLLQVLTKRILESALKDETTNCLGYEKLDPPEFTQRQTLRDGAY